MPPRVTIKEGAAPASATSELMGSAAQEVTVSDGRGRQISLKKPGLLAQYRLVEAMGAERAANDRLYMMCLPLTYLAAIDGEPVSIPPTYLGIEALVQRLDDAGLEAIMLGVQENWGAPDPEATKAALKNS